MNARSASISQSQESQNGKAAVDGLIAGATAGTVMIGYLLLTSGDTPIELLNRFSADAIHTSPAIGAVAHLAVSALYGMVFTVGWRTVGPQRSRLLHVTAGAVYGLVLFATAQWLILPAAQSPLLDLPTVHWATAHAIYGIVLGLLLKSTR